MPGYLDDGVAEVFCPRHPDLLLYTQHGKLRCPRGHKVKLCELTVDQDLDGDSD